MFDDDSGIRGWAVVLTNPENKKCSIKGTYQKNLKQPHSFNTL